MEDGVDGAGVVFHIEPIAHILALAVHGQGLAGADVVDEEGDELLRELVGAVVVRAIGYQCGQPVGVVEGSHEVVAGGLGGTVGAVGGVRCAFCKEGAVKLQRAVHLIRGDVVKALALHVPLPVVFGCLQQGEGAQNVCFCKGEGVFDGAVYMAFRRQMDDAIEPVLFKKRADGLKITDVGLDKRVIWSIFNVLQVGKVAGIGEGVQIDDAVFRVLINEKAHYV